MWYSLAVCRLGIFLDSPGGLMFRFSLVVAAVVALVFPILSVQAQSPYPEEVLEDYAACMERNDLEAIKELLWVHANVERIDATVYGLPRDDFDDQSLLTIAERLEYRAGRAARLETLENDVPMAISGPLQYPHHLRPALDHFYETSGERVDCSEILGRSGATPPAGRDLGSGWATDFNITQPDHEDRGEVDLVIDHASPGRVMASSCPSGGGGESSNHIGATSDWGQTWTDSKVGNNAGSSWECDPVSYYQSSTGNVYHSKVACNYNCSSTWVKLRVSDDNGVSWSDCGTRPGVDSSEDRQWHVADNTEFYDANGDGIPETANTCYGNLYVTWHNTNQQKVARSTDDCATWSSRTNLTGTYQAITPDINVAADGHVYAVWQNQGNATFKIAGSDDCGVTWDAPAAKAVKDRLGDWKNNIPAQCQRGISTMPNVDVDRAPKSQFYGRVYMTMFDFNQAGCGSGPGCSDWNSACNYDIWFTYSDDEGATWATPTNITAGDGNKVDHFMGYMRVDEADGSIYIAHHRSRLNPTELADRQKTHYFVLRSIDGGATWQQFQASSLEGNERLAGGNSFERGDYNRLDVYAGVAWPVWVDRRDTAGEEEIVVRKLCSEPSHWSERAPTFTAPVVTATAIGSKNVRVEWDLPDIYWGDADENPAARKFQLWVDGALEQDNISAVTDEVIWQATECSTQHAFMIRAINQCGLSKDYALGTATATGCCENNPTVNVTPDGPVTSCVGTAVGLTAQITGGTGPFTYQWYRDGSVISGATNAAYSASNNGTHTYNCRVKGSGCTDYAADPSDVALTWMDAPVFSGLETVTDAVASTCGLDLDWSAATTACPGPITYSVYRSTTQGFTPGSQNLVKSGVTSTSFADDQGLVSGVEHYYIVRAKDGSTGNEDGNFDEVSGTPTGPVTLGTWTDDAGDTGSAKLSLEAPWSVNATGGNSGPKVYQTGAYAANLCVAATTPSLHLGANAQLSFYSSYDIEDNWDKGEVQISADGGGSWTRLEVGYPGTATNTSDACNLGSGDFFSGTDASFGQYTASLATWANQDVMIRWEFSSDAAENGNGWWVDDISITNVEVPGTCETMTENIFDDDFESGGTSAWSNSNP
jgi:hypothetical protein